MFRDLFGAFEGGFGDAVGGGFEGGFAVATRGWKGCLGWVRLKVRLEERGSRRTIVKVSV